MQPVLIVRGVRDPLDREPPRLPHPARPRAAIIMRTCLSNVLPPPSPAVPSRSVRKHPTGSASTYYLYKSLKVCPDNYLVGGSLARRVELL
jgi:hypothetical protein